MFLYLLALLLAPTDTYNLDQALNAIKMVEVGNSSGIGTIGDNGKAFGPFQIHESYWIDSGIAGSHRQCLQSYDYSKRVVISYMERYAPNQTERLKNGTASLTDVETLARIHNGGPRGHTKKATIGYWNKVNKCLIRN